MKYELIFYTHKPSATMKYTGVTSHTIKIIQKFYNNQELYNLTEIKQGISINNKCIGMRA